MALRKGNGRQLSAFELKSVSSIVTNGVFSKKLPFKDCDAGERRSLILPLSFADLHWYQMLSVIETASKNIELYVVSVYSICIEALKVIFLKSR